MPRLFPSVAISASVSHIILCLLGLGQSYIIDERILGSLSRAVQGVRIGVSGLQPCTDRMYTPMLTRICLGVAGRKTCLIFSCLNNLSPQVPTYLHNVFVWHKARILIRSHLYLRLTNWTSAIYTINLAFRSQPPGPFGGFTSQSSNSGA